MLNQSKECMNVGPENFFTTTFFPCMADLLRLLDLEDKGSMIICNVQRLATSTASVGTSSLTKVLFFSAFFLLSYFHSF
jgi:hypothetical protein